MPTTTNIHWIDEYINNVNDYIYVREVDNLLIKRPNMATKINKTGTIILKHLTSGGTYAELLDKVGHDKAQQIEAFIGTIKSYLEGNLSEFDQHPLIEQTAFEMNFTDLPVLSELALTYKCNLKCKFCYAGCNCTVNPVSSEKELSLRHFKKIIDKIYFEAQVPSISFTGGEPTLRKKVLLELISYARKLGMRVNLISNGNLINKNYAHDLKNAGLHSAQISIEGTNAKTHYELTQIKGSFEKGIAAIGFLKENNIHVHSNTTLTKVNAADCLQLPDFVKNVLEIDRFSMNLVIPTGSTTLNNDLVIPYSEVGDILTNIQRESKKHEVEFMWYSPVPMCMFNTITNELGNKGCSACDGLVSVAPNGDILPCASYDESVGSLKNKKFNKVWNNTKAVSFRKKEFAHSLCKKCEHFSICNGACPLYWRTMGYNELEKMFQ